MYEGGEIDDYSRNTNSNIKRDGSRGGGRGALTMAKKIGPGDFKAKSGTGGTAGKDSSAAPPIMNANSTSVKKSQVYNQSALDGMEDFDDASYEGNVYSWKDQPRLDVPGNPDQKSPPNNI